MIRSNEFDSPNLFPLLQKEVKGIKEIDEIEEKKILSFLKEINSSSIKSFQDSLKDPTNTIWYQLLSDINIYLSFYVSIRGAYWEMRVGALKKFAPIWSACGHYNYEWMIARHFMDLERWPTAIKSMLFDGGFSVNMKAGKLNGLGVDEIHEMVSSHGIKSNLLRVSDEACLRTASALNFGGPFSEKLKEYFGIIETDRDDYARYEINVQKLASALLKTKLFAKPTFFDPNVICDIFSQRKAEEIETLDALQVHTWGYEQFEDFALRWAAAGFCVRDLKKIRKKKKGNKFVFYLLLQKIQDAKLQFTKLQLI